MTIGILLGTTKDVARSVQNKEDPMVNGVNFLFEQGLTTEELEQAMDLLDVLSEKDGQVAEVALSDDETLIAAAGAGSDQSDAIR